METLIGCSGGCKVPRSQRAFVLGNFATVARPRIALQCDTRWVAEGKKSQRAKGEAHTAMLHRCHPGQPECSDLSEMPGWTLFGPELMFVVMVDG